MSDHINKALEPERKIAIVWSAEDVKGICPELSDEQCWQVLQEAAKRHDSSVGINWDVLKSHADAMFAGEAHSSGFAKRITARRQCNDLPGCVKQ